MRQLIKTIAKNTPLYPAYRQFADRRRMKRMSRHFWDWSDEDQRRFEFYRQFVAAGDVVFDVGANLGNRTKIFSKLGAVVVAIEPQVACADFLRSVFRDKSNFRLVRSALGSSVGQAELMISNAHTISSLSPDWIRSVKESGRFAEYTWDRKVTVPVETLDNLIAEHGRPAFIKIDVEGFEDQVLSGLSRPVGALSLEFTPEFMESTSRCIRHLGAIGDVRFQMSLGESMEFALPEWVTAEGIRSALAGVSRTAFGDLYARFKV